MDNEYNQLKNKIRISYFSKLYHNTILLCKRYFRLIRKFHRKEYNDARQDLYFINYYIGCSYKKIKDIKKAIHHIKKSIRYSLTDTEINNARFVLGKCYSRRGYNNRAINNFQQCLHFYNLIDSKNNRARVLFQMAKAQGKPKHMKKIVNIMENLNENTDTVRNSYMKLILYYLDHNNLKEAIVSISNIKNVNIQQQLLNTIKIMPQIA